MIKIDRKFNHPNGTETNKLQHAVFSYFQAKSVRSNYGSYIQGVTAIVVPGQELSVVGAAVRHSVTKVK